MNTKGTPIAYPLRIWLAVEVLFGIAAVLAVGIAPAETETNFAWTIRPVVMAAVLGAFYMSSAPLFLLPLFAHRWEMIRTMILPVALFSTVQLAATFLHWDKFAVGTTPFYVWFASYLLPPPIFVGAYVWHQQKAVSNLPVSDDPIPGWLHRLLVVCGGILTLAAALAFFIPGLLIPILPWQFTPLTLRSLSGWLVAVGMLLLSMSYTNDKIRSRLASPMLILILPMLCIQLARYASEVNWSSPVLWIGLILFAIAGFCGLVIARGSWRETLR